MGVYKKTSILEPCVVLVRTDSALANESQTSSFSVKACRVPTVHNQRALLSAAAYREVCIHV